MYLPIMIKLKEDKKITSNVFLNGGWGIAVI